MHTTVSALSPRTAPQAVVSGAPARTPVDASARRERRRPARVNPIAHLSHELKNPLGAVMGFAQLMTLDETEPLTEGQRRRVELIEQAGRHMLSIIAGLLQPPSATAAGANGADEGVADLAALVREVTDWMQPVAERYGVELRAEPVQGRVRGGARCVRQVLLNLLSNASKYNTRGGRVCVRQVACSDAASVGIEVSDTGLGMTPDMLARLFTPFDRLGRADSNVEGTGVGLCIVRDLVERAGGHIEVQSNCGLGSRFCVWFQAA